MHVDCVHPKVAIVDPKTGVPTPFFLRWIYCMRARTGGEQDFIEDLQTQNDVDYVTNSRLDDVTRNIDQLQLTIENIPIVTSQVSELKKQISELQLLLEISPVWESKLIDQYQYLTTSTNYTTTGKQIVIVTSNVTITLNQTPKDKENCIIKRATSAGEVTIDAVSRNVDGATTHTLLVNYECVQCVYSYDNDEWYII